MAPAQFADRGFAAWLRKCFLTFPPRRGETADVAHSRLVVYYESLKHHTKKATQESLKEALRSFRWMPTVAELNEFFAGMPSESTGSEPRWAPGVLANIWANEYIKTGKGADYLIDAIVGRYDDFLKRWASAYGASMEASGGISGRLVRTQTGRTVFKADRCDDLDTAIPDETIEEWRAAGARRG
jgi:hypothetical protein